MADRKTGLAVDSASIEVDPASILVHHDYDFQTRQLVLTYIESSVDDRGRKSVAWLRQKVTSLEAKHSSSASSGKIKICDVEKKLQTFAFELGNADALSSVETVWKGKDIEGRNLGVWNILMNENLRNNSSSR